MRILAIETSGRRGSLALLSSESGEIDVLREVVLASDQRTAQSLAPELQQLLLAADWPPASIRLVAVAVGPGSFTGLRIGVTTAKAFAYGVGAETIGVNTLEVLATQTEPLSAPVWTIMDAQRQELFAAKFVAAADAEWQTLSPAQILTQENWLVGLQPGDRVTGPGLQRLVQQLPSNVEVVQEHLWEPTAAAVGRLAWQAYNRGQRDDVWKLNPVYYRSSAAEEKALRRADH